MPPKRRRVESSVSRPSASAAAARRRRGAARRMLGRSNEEVRKRSAEYQGRLCKSTWIDPADFTPPISRYRVRSPDMSRGYRPVLARLLASPSSTPPFAAQIVPPRLDRTRDEVGLAPHDGSRAAACACAGRRHRRGWRNLMRRCARRRRGRHPHARCPRCSARARAAVRVAAARPRCDAARVDAAKTLVSPPLPRGVCVRVPAWPWV